jgi:hypothetical protein
MVFLFLENHGRNNHDRLHLEQFKAIVVQKCLLQDIIFSMVKRIPTSYGELMVDEDSQEEYRQAHLREYQNEILPKLNSVIFG